VGSVASSRIQSEWPQALLLDEIWVRARRCVVHRLEQTGLWMPHKRYLQVMRRQHGIGERLKTRSLNPILGAEAGTLYGEAAFGPASPRLRSRLEHVLAFGYGWVTDFQ